MPKLTIKLTGTGICYYKNELFKVLFPINGDHQLRFRFKPKGQPTQIELGGVKNRQVAISASKAQPVFIDPTADFAGFIDITAPGQAHPDIRPLAEWNKSAILLTINDGSFSSSVGSDCHYGLEEKTEPKDTRRETMPPREIKFEAIVTIDDPDISMEVHPPLDGFPNPIKFDGTDQEISFDNTCPTCPTKDDSYDFDLIYQVIEEVPTGGSAGRQLAMKRYYWHQPFLAYQLLEVTIAYFTEEDGKSGIHQVNNPPKFAKGLPCNITTATKSWNLP